MYVEIGKIMGGGGPVVLYFEILSRHSLGRAEESHVHRRKSIGAPILLGRCPSLSVRESESILRTYLVCTEKRVNRT
jgi:hypothetical protein